LIERIGRASGTWEAAASAAVRRAARAGAAALPVPAVRATVLDPAPREGSAAFLTQLLAQEGGIGTAPARPGEAAAPYASRDRNDRPQLGWIDI